MSKVIKGLGIVGVVGVGGCLVAKVFNEYRKECALDSVMTDIEEIKTVHEDEENSIRETAKLVCLNGCKHCFHGSCKTELELGICDMARALQCGCNVCDDRDRCDSIGFVKDGRCPFNENFAGEGFNECDDEPPCECEEETSGDAGEDAKTTASLQGSDVCEKDCSKCDFREECEDSEYEADDDEESDDSEESEIKDGTMYSNMGKGVQGTKNGDRVFFSMFRGMNGTDLGMGMGGATPLNASDVFGKGSEFKEAMSDVKSSMYKLGLATATSLAGKLDELANKLSDESEDK